MSIFKESFKDYVVGQIGVREALVGQKSDRFGNKKLIDSKNKLHEVSTGAFYTYTLNKTCALRMSSGVDLIEDFGLDGPPYEDYEDLKAEGLAKRWVLEGGVKNQNILRGGLGKEKGKAYGDPYIRSDATSDGYGIVPMPGILSANVRTETAYGSLRSAKIDWVCHNLRQLEILELLYMRPGYPVLLEWGWSPYITNKGQIENDFPYNKYFFLKNQSQENLTNQIIKTKKDSNGNYDGLFGIIKNFSFTSRGDGGFTCVTELISMGEVLESIKGKITPIVVYEIETEEVEE